jgi:hypothetical protein
LIVCFVSVVAQAELASLHDKMQDADNEKAAMEAHWQDQVRLLRAEHERELVKMRAEVAKAQETARRSSEEAANARRLSVKPLLQATTYQSFSAEPSPAPGQSIPPFTPTATRTPSGGAEAAPVNANGPKSVPTVSTYASPKPAASTGRVSKAYVNHYASFEDPAEQHVSHSAPTTVSAPAVKMDTPAVGHYNPYNYSTEIKEESSAPVYQRPTPSHTEGALRRVASGNSLRRDELADPEDERDPSPTQLLNSSSAGASSGWNKAHTAVQAGIRMMHHPGSGAPSPMPPAGTGAIPYSGAPQGPPNPLQVPRSQLKSNPIRAALRNEAQTKPASGAPKTPGAYMTPHSMPYQVMSAATEEGQRTRSVPPPSPSPTQQQGYLSATKATARQQQLIKESARETFAKTYTYQKKAF